MALLWSTWMKCTATAVTTVNNCSHKETPKAQELEPISQRILYPYNTIPANHRNTDNHYASSNRLQTPFFIYRFKCFRNNDQLYYSFDLNSTKRCHLTLPERPKIQQEIPLSFTRAINKHEQTIPASMTSSRDFPLNLWRLPCSTAISMRATWRKGYSHIR